MSAQRLFRGRILAQGASLTTRWGTLPSPRASLTLLPLVLLSGCQLFAGIGERTTDGVECMVDEDCSGTETCEDRVCVGPNNGEGGTGNGGQGGTNEAGDNGGGAGGNDNGGNDAGGTDAGGEGGEPNGGNAGTNTAGTGAVGGTGGAGGSNPGGPACGQVEPCGGDLTGTWDWATTCANLEAASAVLQQNTGCAGAQVTQSDVALEGSVTFNADGSFTESSTRVDNSMIYAPIYCSTGSTCEEVAAQEAASVAPGTTFLGCEDAASSPGAAPDGCACGYETDYGSSTTDGTYAADSPSATLDFYSPAYGGYFATYAYCVSGDYMHWTELSANGHIVYDRVGIRRGAR